MGGAAWASARRILCVRLDSMGDVLMTTPAIRALREAGPGRHIALLTSASGAEAAALVPEIDGVVEYDPPWMKHTPQRGGPAPDLAMVERLRDGRFDAAVIFTVYSQNPLPAAMLCYLADIPLRLAHCHENPYQLLTHWVPDPEPAAGIRHEVQRQLDLVASVGATDSDDRLSIAVPAAARRAALQAVLEAAIDRERPWVVLHPGATAPSRRYPPDLFAEVLRGLAAFGVQVVVTGSAAERQLAETVIGLSGASAANLAGELSLPGLAALIQLAPVLVSNNSGPVHIAAAVGTPVVDIYALTNPQHTPWQVENRLLTHDVPCRNCLRSVCPEGHHNCLRLIPPAAVAEAALELLRARARELLP
ncbi:MAG: lipopolysaccharide heptosyltransferase II [Hyphomicrobiales bacterium]